MKILNKYKYTHRILVALVVCLIVVLAISLAKKTYNEGEVESLEQLVLTNEIHGQNFQIKMNQCINDLMNVEQLFYENHTRAEIIGKLMSATSNTDFTHIMYMDTLGYAYTETSESYKVWDKGFFDKVMYGSIVVEEPTDQYFDGTYVPVIVPVEYGDKVQGALIGLLSISKFEAYIEEPFIDNGMFYLVDEKGNIFAWTEGAKPNQEQQLFIESTEDGMLFRENITLSDHHTAMQDVTGDIKIQLDQHAYYAAYYKTNMNDWYIITIVEKGDLILQYMEGMSVQMLVIIFLLIMLAYLIFHKAKKDSGNYDKELENMTYYDKLTGLPNQIKFQSDIKTILSENPGEDFVITVIDIIDFKSVNEFYGFQVGDEALCVLAERFSALTTELGLFGKGVKDEFWYFDTVEGMNKTLGMSDYLERKLFLDKEAFKNFNISLRYGTYYIEDNNEAILKIVENAQFAHAMAKKEDKRHTIFNVETKNKIMYETNIMGRQEAALLNREFLVFMQPKYLLNTEKIIGAEALIRWVQKDGEILSPVKFLPVFEKNGFIKQVDMFMFEETCKIIQSWMKQGIEPTKISVNFSRLHLESSTFVDSLIEIMSKYEVPKKYVELELTETIASENEEQLVKVLEEVHANDLTMAIDDFGSGYSSLGILRKMKFDVIKLDKSFLWDNENEVRSKSIIKSMIKLCKDLNATIVAEGVERREDVDFLRTIDCDIAQGFYFSKPMIHHEFTELLQNRLPEDVVSIEE